MTKLKAKDFFLNAKRQRRLPSPLSVSFDGLLAKSRHFAKRGLAAKAAGDEVHYQLWAAGALELLAKTQLAGIHPTLAADPENPNSLLEACGVSTGTSVRTIAAKVAYARLRHTVTGFTTAVHAECIKLAERRNAELHSGEAACASVPLEAWEGDFWNATEIVLESMDMDLAEWLGADSDAPAHLLAGYRSAKRNAAIQRIKQNAEAFSKTPEGRLKGKKWDEFLSGLPILISPRGAAKDMRYMYKRYWPYACPACKSWAVVGGDLDWEEVADDQDDAHPGSQFVTHGYIAEELYCPTCKLALVGAEALAAGEVDEGFEETVEEEIEYGEEYGND